MTPTHRAEPHTPDPAAATGESAPPVAATPLDPASARTPLAAARAAYTGAFLALVLLALGAVGIRDSIVAAGWFSGNGTLWTSAAIDWIDGLRPAAWMIPAGVAAAIIGAWFLVLALAPRRRTAVVVDASTSIYIDPHSIARVATLAAREVDGVLDATSTATRKKIRVRVTTTGDDTVPAAVTHAVRTALTPLASTPKISVDTRSGGRS